MSQTVMIICDRCGKASARQATGDSAWMQIESGRVPDACIPSPSTFKRDLCPPCWADHERFMKHERT